MLLTVASGHRTYPAGDHGEPQGAVQHRRRPYVAPGRGQQSPWYPSSSTVDQLRHPAAVVVLDRRRRRSAARCRLHVGPRWLRGSVDQEEVARPTARVDVVQHREDVAEEQQNITVTFSYQPGVFLHHEGLIPQLSYNTPGVPPPIAHSGCWLLNVAFTVLSWSVNTGNSKPTQAWPPPWVRHPQLLNNRKHPRRLLLMGRRSRKLKSRKNSFQVDSNCVQWEALKVSTALLCRG